MSYKENNKKNGFFRSVTFVSWASFLILAFLIIAIMFGAFLLAYSTLYGREKVNEYTSSANVIMASFPNRINDPVEREEFERALDEQATLHDLSVTVFTVAEGADLPNVTADDINLIAYKGYTATDEGHVTELDRDFFSKMLLSEGKTFSYSKANPDYDGIDIIVGGSRMTDIGEVYFYVEAIGVSSEIEMDFFLRMFAGIAVGAFLVSVLYAYFVTKLIAKPLVLFTRAVKTASDNKDYILELEGNGFSEIDELAVSLNNSVREQKKTEEFRRDLIANVSHDLRTPLTMIKAYAEMVRDLSGNNPQKREEHCQIIVNEVEVLNHLVGDLLDLSKMEAGTVEFVKKEQSLSAITKTVVERLDIFRLRDGYDFIVDIEENCNCMCDSARTEQAVYNLICNAINYTGADKKVFVSLKKKDGKIRFEVKDTGKGIKPDEIDDIWDRYYRSQRSKRSVAGSGIGLSIVQNVLTQQGVDFGVISKENEGATFWFEFDAIKDTDEDKVS